MNLNQHNIYTLSIDSPEDLTVLRSRYNLNPGFSAGQGTVVKVSHLSETLLTDLKNLIMPFDLRLSSCAEEHSGCSCLLAGSAEDFCRFIDNTQGPEPALETLFAELRQALQPPRTVVEWSQRRMDFSKKTYVMGILNCTSDSFYPGSRLETTRQAVTAAKAMIADGVDILDVGGESTRPGSEAIDPQEELERILPVIREIREQADVLISVDTYKAEVAEKALQVGADLINDITGLRDNPRLAELAASRGVPIVLMHLRGSPQTMQDNPYYADTIGEIVAELREAVQRARQGGVAEDHIIVDPGIGFGKRMEDNLEIIRRLSSFRAIGLPLLIGLSRKSFIGAALNAEVDERLFGTVTANTMAILNGADIIRVHDVKPAIDMVRMIAAIRAGLG